MGYRPLFIPAIRQTRYTLFLNHPTHLSRPKSTTTCKIAGTMGIKALVIDKPGRYTLPLTIFDWTDFSFVFVPSRDAFCWLRATKILGN
jgi:hypothetical protein